MKGKPDIPLGKPETDRLELKGAKSLENLRSLARGVVALLNAKGGQLWIGLAEHEGIAKTPEPIASLRRQAARLQDGLLDLVEPVPILGEEVEVVPVPIAGGADEGFLRVDVKAGRRGPYAFLDGSLRGYVVRAGSRTRPMTSDELRARFSKEREGDVREEMSAALLEEMSLAAADGFRGLQLLLKPELPGGLELPLDPKAVDPLFRDPLQTGNRPTGWVFTSSSGELKATRGGLVFGAGPNMERVTVQRRGLVRYREPLERLVWRGPPNEIWPYALVEFPTSVLRLAQRLYAPLDGSIDPEAPVAAALALFGIKGWTLRPHSPRAVGYLTSPASVYEEDPLIPDPLIFSWKDLQSSPDHCAYRLLVRIYEAFGYFEDALPSELSRETGALTIAS